MVAFSHERILLIGDLDRQVQAVVAQALPGAHLTAVGNIFDGIAELGAGHFTTVITAAEPIERRPEAAVHTLRHLLGEGKLLLYGHATLEPLSRRMLDYGCDDYIVAPPSVDELQQVFGSSPLRLAEPTEPVDTESADYSDIVAADVVALQTMPLAEIFMDAMVQHPNAAGQSVIQQINERLSPPTRLFQSRGKSIAPLPEPGTRLLTHPIRSHGDVTSALHMMVPEPEDETPYRHALSQIAQLMSRLSVLQDRHNRLQKLAITDELTGLYNGRYFRHFLESILEKARNLRFPVTLLLFDIDNFKKYNDQFGHGVGDQILKQTATLMKKCCRDHDLVARISGDEFAVVFWEKDGPRQPRDARVAAAGPSRPPQTPLIILDRFRKLISTEDFTGLGPGGQGTLTISGGLAVFPYDASTAQGLITAADRALMFGAKQSGKNSIFLVGGGTSGDAISDNI